MLKTFILEASSSDCNGHVSNVCIEKIKLELWTKAFRQKWPNK